MSVKQNDELRYDRDRVTPYPIGGDAGCSLTLRLGKCFLSREDGCSSAAPRGFVGGGGGWVWRRVAARR
ncbi:MAG: hypothetical protein KatS3mg055_3468 [Chloroflexus sp.]|nr:MAG: hypothetical protein KatS3mg055_3468 [Chloroflexus sp.]